MAPSQDLQELLRGTVLAVLAVATGYHLTRLLRRPFVDVATPTAVDAAHALMGGVMLLMLDGWVGPGAALGWAVCFAVVGVVGAFTRSRSELVIGSAAMTLMLVAGPSASTAATAPAMTGRVGMASMASGTSSAGFLTKTLVTTMIVALMAMVVRSLLRARPDQARSSRTRDTCGRGWPYASTACRVGLNLGSVYMLTLMVWT